MKNILFPANKNILSLARIELFSCSSEHMQMLQGRRTN